MQRPTMINQCCKGMYHSLAIAVEMIRALTRVPHHCISDNEIVNDNSTLPLYDRSKQTGLGAVPAPWRNSHLLFAKFGQLERTFSLPRAVIGCRQDCFHFGF